MLEKPVEIPVLIQRVGVVPEVAFLICPVMLPLPAHGLPFRVQGQRECRVHLPHSPAGYFII